MWKKSAEYDLHKVCTTTTMLRFHFIPLKHYSTKCIFNRKTMDLTYIYGHFTYFRISFVFCWYQSDRFCPVFYRYFVSLSSCEHKRQSKCHVGDVRSFFNQTWRMFQPSAFFTFWLCAYINVILCNQYSSEALNCQYYFCFVLCLLLVSGCSDILLLFALFTPLHCFGSCFV